MNFHLVSLSMGRYIKAFILFICSARRRPRVFSVYTAPRKQVPLNTSPLQCFSSSLSTTSFKEPLSTQAPSLLLTTAPWTQIIAPTSRIAGQFGISFGAVLSRSFHVHGLLFIRTFLVQKSGTQLYCLPSIASRCSFVLCLCQNMFWHGQLDSS